MLLQYVKAKSEKLIIGFIKNKTPFQFLIKDRFFHIVKFLNIVL